MVDSLRQGQISYSVFMCSRPKKNKLEKQPMLQEKELHRWKVYSLIVHHIEGKDKGDNICTFLCRSRGWKSTWILSPHLRPSRRRSLETDSNCLFCRAVFREPKSSCGACSSISIQTLKSTRTVSVMKHTAELFRACELTLKALKTYVAL